MRILKYFSILLLTISLSACGFHLVGKGQIPPKLHYIYVNSDQPYSQFTKQVKTALKQRGVRLAGQADEAPFTLNISNEKLTHSQSGIGTSQQARQYNITFGAIFSITNNKSNKKVYSFGLSASTTETLFSGQLLENSNQLQIAEQQLTRNVLGQLFYHLGSADVRLALDNKKIPPSNQ